MSVDPAELTATVVALMKGVVHRDTHEVVWQHVLRLQPQLRDHFDVTGLVVVVDEAEGYAYLRSRPVPDGEDGPPRLVARRTLTFQTSLLLALLRKKLAEHDATSSETRLVLSRDQLVDMIRVFLPDSSNEAKVLDQLDATIGKVVDLGYLRRVRGDRRLWEVRRILKAFVDAEWLAELDARLAEYASALAAEAPVDDVPAAQEVGRE